MPAPVGIVCVDCLREAQKKARPVRSRLGFTAAPGPPLVTYLLIGLNVTAFLYGSAVLGEARWLGDWGLYPGFTDDFFGVGTEPYRWITAAFAHVGILHLGMNMLALWQLGNVLEPAIGRLRFGLLYGGSLLGGSASVMLIGDPAVGASGAVFGLLAAYAVVLRRLKLKYTQVLVIAVIFIVGPIIGQLAPAVFGVFANISWQAHLGGAVVGAVLMTGMLAAVDRRSRRG